MVIKRPTKLGRRLAEHSENCTRERKYGRAQKVVTELKQNAGTQGVQQ